MKKLDQILWVITCCAAFSIGAICIFAKEKPPEPPIGKLYVQDAQGNWTRLTSLPNDNLYLHCADAQGKFQPCVIEKVEFAPRNPDVAADFPQLGRMNLRPREK